MNDVRKNAVMYNSDEVEHTLENTFMTDALRSAREKELGMVHDQLSTLEASFKVPLKIFDIGVGDGYVPLNLGSELLKNIESYIGIDNSRREVEQCERNIHEAGLGEKVKTFQCDATNMSDHSFRELLPLPFHAVICTYFTPGNFRPDEILMQEDKKGHIVKYPREALRPNRKFQNVFSEAYKLLDAGGRLILGSTYIDSEATRVRQEEFYKKCGMHVITGADDEFTATREGFWSERFTEQKLYEYIDWAPWEQVEFIPLDSEEFARMVVIKK